MPEVQIDGRAVGRCTVKWLPNFLVYIHYFPIVHNALCLPPKFCINYCCEILLGGAFRNNSLCKIWGANRVHYGELENREWIVYHIVLPMVLRCARLARESSANILTFLATSFYSCSWSPLAFGRDQNIWCFPSDSEALAIKELQI